MIQSGQYHIVADQSAVVNCNAALILKFTAYVDENPFADRNVFSAVGIKRRKKAESFIHLLSDDAGKDFPYLFRRMVAAIQLRRELQSLLSQLMHVLVNGRICPDGPLGAHFLLKFYVIHQWFLSGRLHGRCRRIPHRTWGRDWPEKVRPWFPGR